MLRLLRLLLLLLLLFSVRLCVDASSVSYLLFQTTSVREPVFFAMHLCLFMSDRTPPTPPPCYDAAKPFLHFFWSFYVDALLSTRAYLIVKYWSLLLFCQVAEPLPPGRKMVRQLMHVNGVEADELTLAEVRAEIGVDESGILLLLCVVVVVVVVVVVGCCCCWWYIVPFQCPDVV